MSDTSDPLEILDAIDRERGDSSIGMIQANQVQRLRGEIVALRERCAASDVNILIEVGRNEALEEAAQVVEDYFNPETCEPCAAAIRTLKNKP